MTNPSRHRRRTYSPTAGDPPSSVAPLLTRRRNREREPLNRTEPPRDEVGSSTECNLLPLSSWRSGGKRGQIPFPYDRDLSWNPKPKPGKTLHFPGSDESTSLFQDRPPPTYLLTHGSALRGTLAGVLHRRDGSSSVRDPISSKELLHLLSVRPSAHRHTTPFNEVRLRHCSDRKEIGWVGVDVRLSRPTVVSLEEFVTDNRGVSKVTKGRPPPPPPLPHKRVCVYTCLQKRPEKDTHSHTNVGVCMRDL